MENLDEFFEVGDYDRFEITKKLLEERKKTKIDNRVELIKKGLVIINDMINNSENGEFFTMNYKEKTELKVSLDLLKNEYQLK
jgi:hypothetical protein